MKRKLEARGDQIWVDLCLVDFNNGKKGNVSNMSLGKNPAEYAELVLETFRACFKTCHTSWNGPESRTRNRVLKHVLKHIQSKYRFVPDSLEIINEPSNGADWLGNTGTKIGKCMIAAMRRLAANGFRLKEVMAPSSSRAHVAIAHFDQMIKVPGVSDLLTAFSYHKYGSTGNSTTYDGCFSVAGQTKHGGLKASRLPSAGRGAV